MIRCLVTDLDGTLFHNYKENLFDLSDENHQMMQEIALKNDLKLCIASGRNVYYGQYILNKYNIVDQSISGYNGVTCLDQNKFAYKEIIPLELLEEIYEIGKDLKGIRDFQLLAFNGDRIFHDLKAVSIPRFQKEIDILQIGKIHEDTIEEYLKKEVAKDSICKVCLNFEDTDSALAAFEVYKQHLEGRCFITKSSDKAVEIGDLYRNKGSFIEYLKKAYGYHSDEIAAIGDALNDTDMFKHVTYSFAMAHANKDVKEMAKYTVDSVYECYKKIQEINNFKE